GARSWTVARATVWPSRASACIRWKQWTSWPLERGQASFSLTNSHRTVAGLRGGTRAARSAALQVEQGTQDRQQQAAAVGPRAEAASQRVAHARQHGVGRVGAVVLALDAVAVVDVLQVRPERGRPAAAPAVPAGVLAQQ